MYHEDIGNFLCNKEKKDDLYYKYLEKIANSVALELNKRKY
jgi:hypothetical protein